LGHKKQLKFMKPAGRGLYAITDTKLIHDTHQLVTAVEQTILGGAQLIQYRDKSTQRKQRRQQARALQAICGRYGIPLIINDDVELAAAIHADGVHLGKDDTSLQLARASLGDTAIIGVSCYNRLDLALQATQAGADYVAFGSFFPSSTKPAAVSADIPLLREAKQRLSVPIVAIGGITPNNSQALVDAGADFLAVINGVFANADVRRAAQSYSAFY
jgi:thiamine-phosphate pyrophosphorylase